jgi:hypothetical protein
MDRDEIRVTPEMIEAGWCAYWESAASTEREKLEAAYRAMRALDGTNCSLGIHEEFLSEHGPGCTEFEKTYYLATCKHCHRSRRISKVDGKELSE